MLDYYMDDLEEWTTWRREEPCNCELKGRITHQTKAAMLLTVEDGVSVWIPLRCIEFMDQVKDVVTIRIPAWLYGRKQEEIADLVYEQANDMDDEIPF